MPSSAVLPYPEREQVGPARPGVVRQEVKPEAMSALGKQMGLDRHLRFAAGVDPDEAIVDVDEAIVERGDDEARRRVGGYVERWRPRRHQRRIGMIAEQVRLRAPFGEMRVHRDDWIDEPGKRRPRRLLIGSIDWLVDGRRMRHR